MKHVVQFSGGVASWATAKRVAERHGTDDLVLLFADTSMEDEDLYRFIKEAHANVGGELVWLKDGRTPWDIFFHERFMGNHRVDPCSKILKRHLLDKWHNENCTPEDSQIYLGYTWDTQDERRLKPDRWLPWTVSAPLCEYPERSKEDCFRLLVAEGIKRPRLYDEGFPHNNCGGFCIKAGQANFKLLHEKRPELYAFHEAKEQEFRQFIGKDVAIMRDRSGGTSTPLTMKAFRERLEANKADYEQLDFGGCNCMDAGVPGWAA